ncbi:hypothetical protein AUEXF2481DRAFT_38286 [Aureobasidium subglaciale EXF-2481]|uniref:Uncharacterized protein n=1 Tax=Aureobasidium subglaciale (strain EXF-2481) TaxID=1043005 RepID=A0A074YGB9_AURSE|nr:uncharacterized protein AUEXF2481DRAFT_38286 [Aureobasidium subglaciale EXF-2481]KEQ96878.1 hypothetical protein AUEXF2481DRAFT_38286 [Aureobasidium subglaciale EXF-2481]
MIAPRHSTSITPEKKRGFVDWMHNTNPKAQNTQDHALQEASQETAPRTFYPNTTSLSVYSPIPSTHQHAQPPPPGSQAFVASQVSYKRIMVFSPNGSISCNGVSAPRLGRPISQITHEPIPQQQQRQQLASSLTPQGSRFAPQFAAKLRSISGLTQQHQLLEPIQQHQQSQQYQDSQQYQQYQQYSSNQYHQPHQQQHQPPRQYQHRQPGQPDLDHLLRSRATSSQQSFPQINSVQGHAGRSPSSEARYQPYPASRAGSSQGSLLFNPQNKPQAGLQHDRAASYPRPHVSARSGPAATPCALQSAVPTSLPTSQNLLQSQVGHGSFQPQHHVVSQPLPSCGLKPFPHSHTSVQAHVRHTSQEVSPTSSDTLPRSSPSSLQGPAPPNSAAQHQPNDALHATVFKSQAVLPTVTQASLPSATHAQLAHVSGPSPAQVPPRPSSHGVWLPELHLVIYAALPLQAADCSEVNHDKQRALHERVRRRPVERLRPHEFLDHLTMDHNISYRPRIAKVYDILFMQALLFHKDLVLLVSQRELKTPRWEPPQSVWHGYDVSTLPSKVPIWYHVRKAINQVTDFQPSEVAPCAGCERHDSPVDIVKTNGKLTHGWAVAYAFDVKPECIRSTLLVHRTDLVIGFFKEHQVEHLNMDPVWKSKLLEVFKSRREIGKSVYK